MRIKIWRRNSDHVRWTQPSLRWRRLIQNDSQSSSIIRGQLQASYRRQRRTTGGYSSVSHCRRAALDPSPVRVKFVVEKVALGRGFLVVLQFFTVSIIPPVPHTSFTHPPLILRDTSNCQRVNNTFTKTSNSLQKREKILLSTPLYFYVLCVVYIISHVPSFHCFPLCLFPSFFNSSPNITPHFCCFVVYFFPLVFREKRILRIYL